MTTADKIAERNKMFQGHSEDLCRLQRDFTSITLRKKKRLEHINKKRANAYADEVFSANLEFPAFIVTNAVKVKYPMIADESLSSIQRLRVLVAALKNSQGLPDADLISCMNRLIARTKSFPFDQVFDDHITEIFLSGLSSADDSLKIDILCCFINIFNESHTEITELILSKNFISICSNYLKFSKNENIIENTLWALSNLMGDNKHITRQVYELNIWRDILRFCSSSSFSLRNTAQWVLSNLARDKHFTEQECLEVIYTAKSGLISDTEDTIKNSAWTIFYLTGSEKLVEFIFQCKIELTLLTLIKHFSSQVQYPVLKIFANISTSSNDEVFKYLINQNFINSISTLLTHPEIKIKSEVLFIFSNFLAASQDVVCYVAFLPCFKVIVKYLESDKFRIKKETICAVCNAACCKNWDVLRHLIGLGVFEKIIEGLHYNSVEVIDWILDAVFHLLQTAQGSIDLDQLQDLYKDLQQMDGFSRLNQLIHSQNILISEKSFRILNFLS